MLHVVNEMLTGLVTSGVGTTFWRKDRSDGKTRQKT